MKKLFLTVIVVFLIGVTSYARPHKEYLDAKECVERFEKGVNSATTCDDLYLSIFGFYMDILRYSDVEYADDERMTEKEEQELDDWLERITNRCEMLLEQWDCETDEDETEDALQRGGSESESEWVVVEEKPDDVVFTIAEVMPEFPGGSAKMSEYLSQNIVYPVEAQKAGIQGKVFVSFVIEKDGSVSNVEVMRGIGSGCDEEAVRVVKAMPKLKPGTQRGKPVRVSYNLPVVFKLQ